MARVLLIEPDTYAAQLYAGALSAAHHSVSRASDAQSALHSLDSAPVDVIILELDMPSHNGLEFLYEFCSYDDWVAIPIIVLSRLPQERYQAMMVDWSELNVHEYLYKPDTSLKALQDTVSAHVLV